MANNSTKSEFDRYVNEYYEERVKANESIEEDLKNRIGVPKSLVNDIVVTIPEVLTGILSGYSKLKNTVQLWSPNESIGKMSEGSFLLAHSLSANSDTIFLLADIGRAVRIGNVIGNGLEVLLAGKEWSRRNWNISKFRERNLVFNEEWRKSIYQDVGANVTVWGIDEIKDESGEEIIEYSSSLLRIAKIIAGEDSIGTKLGREKRKDILDPISIDVKRNGRSTNILNIQIVEEGLKPEIEAIKHIVSRIRYISYDTIMYFLMQKYAQESYEHCTKTGIDREIDFDEPFYLMSQGISGSISVKRGVYFKNYELEDEEGESLTVHPYCFPSGTLFSKYSFEDCLSMVPHMDEMNDEGALKESLMRLPYPHNARFCADILSFIHFYSLPDLKELRDFVADEISEISTEWAESWNYYAKDPETFKNRLSSWSRLWASRWYENAPPVPYHYFPYFEFTRDTSKEEIIMKYASILNRLSDEIEIQNWVEP